MGLAAFNRMRRMNAQKIPVKETVSPKSITQTSEHRSLEDMSYNELRALAKDKGINALNMKKIELLEALQAKEGE